MSTFQLASGGSVPTFRLDLPNTFSLDPGPYASPEAGPNTPVNTGGAKTVALNFNCTDKNSGQILATINNPG